jgi:hypothetical protein
MACVYILLTFLVCLTVLWWLFFTAQGLNVLMVIMLIVMAALATPLVLLGFMITKAIWFS